MITLDFETYGIEKRPDYPPKPIGLAIQYDNSPPKYYGFGHESGNNSTYDEVYKILRSAYESGEPLLFHNSKFDLEVAEKHFDLPLPPWERVHDTMYMIFIHDPHTAHLGLKPCSESLLGIPPDEQDALGDWLVTNKGKSKAPTSKMYYAKFMNLAPGDLVGTYAKGDVWRTKLLFDHLAPVIPVGAYDRERELALILLRMEQQGIQLDVEMLRVDVEMYQRAAALVETKLTERLGGINMGSGQQVMKALMERGLVDSSKLEYTPKGRPKTSKDVLPRILNDSELSDLLRYRGALKTCLSTFMVPWLEMAGQSDGRIFNQWNQTWGEWGGARTGRLSSSPNFQNIPNPFKVELEGLPDLPSIRKYIVPFEGGVLINRDYSSQEPRVLATLMGGSLRAAYADDPWTDLHDHARNALEERGFIYTRKQVKMTNLGLIYGMGVKKLADSTGLTEEEAGELKMRVLDLYPGLRMLYRTARDRAAKGVPVATWGGRAYLAEEGKDYKLVNVLVQGSAADITKQAVINFARIAKPSWKMILCIHDEIVVSTPKEEATEAMEALRAAMEGVPCGVPVLSEGKIGLNFASLVDYDKKGVKQDVSEILGPPKP